MKSRLSRFTVVLLLFAIALAACAPAGGGELTVFAASSLTDAFTELGAAFEAKNPGSSVLFNFGGSSQLATQLIEGAPADVFASANATQMNNAVEAGRISNDPVLFLTNRLVIVVPADNPAGIQSPADLAQPNLRLVLAAPDVPIREYSDQALAALGDAAYQEAVYANLVSEEPNVRQVATKVALGEADAGIIYTSDVTPDIAGQVAQIEIPTEANVIAVYPIATVEGGQAALAQQFVDFVLSAEGQAILAAWGFGPRQ